MKPADFAQSLRTVPVAVITDQIKYYSGFEPRGINYQTLLDCYHAEMERRILAWEVATV
jgi:hypothetical protein